MITGFTDQVGLFDLFLAKNYQTLYRDAISIFKHHEHTQDYLQDVILYARERISRSGFTGNNYYRYVWASLNGKFLTVKRIERQKKKDFHYEFPNQDVEYDEVQDANPFSNEVELALRLQQEMNDDDLLYQEEIQYHCERIFRFVDVRHSPKAAHLFKSYYKEPKCTYSKLSKRTGYHFSYCQQTISEIKKDIKRNYLVWLNEQETNNNNNLN